MFVLRVLRHDIEPQFAEALLGMEVGHELIVITRLHEARRDVLKGHPRSDESRPLTDASPARTFTRVHLRARIRSGYIPLRCVRLTAHG